MNTYPIDVQDSFQGDLLITFPRVLDDSLLFFFARNGACAGANKEIYGLQLRDEFNERSFSAAAQQAYAETGAILLAGLAVCLSMSIT